MVFATDLFLEYKKRPGRAALARLLERHQDAVYTLCRQVLRHSQDAEDACQEILLEVSRQVDSIEEPEKFSGWLYRTALHTALDLKRQRGRRRIREAGAAAPAAAPVPETAELYHGLAGLDETSRTLVVEHYFGRRPLRELAAERGCSEVAVWKRIDHARERLRKALGSVAVSALDGIATVPAPAAILPKALGVAGGLAMATKAGIKVAIVAPLLLLTGVGTVAYVRRPDPTPPPAPAEVRKPAAAAAAPAPSPAASPIPAPQAGAPKSRKPHPFKDPGAGFTGAAAQTWHALSTIRMTLDFQNTPLPELLAFIASKTGIPLAAPAGTELEMISFKVQNIVADGALRLLLQPRGKSYEILFDGTVRIDSTDKIKGGYEKIGQLEMASLHELERIRQELDGGWDGSSVVDHGAKLTQLLTTMRIVSTQEESTLEQEIGRLEELGVRVHVDGPKRNLKPFLRVVSERTILEHVEELARIHGMVAVPFFGQIILTNEEGAAFYRKKVDEPRLAQERLVETLGKPLQTSGSSDVPDFLDAVGRSHGLSVVPTEAAWNCNATMSLPSGTTLREALDQLKPHGLRWAVRDGKLYVFR